MPLRVKFFIAFCLLAGLAVALGGIGIRSLNETSDLVVRLYDQPLMGVSYARAASASLNEARGLMARGLLLPQGQLADLVAALQRSETDIAEDLQIVRQRVREPVVVGALDHARDAIADWFASGRMILAPPAAGVTALPMRMTVDRRGDVAAAALDELVEQVSAIGFSYRTRAETEMRASRATVATLSAGIILASMLFALLFAHLLIRPIRAATRFAEDVAAGRRAGTLPTRRHDEIGRLLSSLGIMQANLLGRATEAVIMQREQEHANQTLRQINLRFDTALNNMSHGLLMCDAAGTIAIVNHRFCDMYEIDHATAANGLSYRDVLALCKAAGSHPDQTIEEILAQDAPLLRHREPASVTRSLSRGRTVAIVSAPMADGGWISTHDDITERCKSQERIAFLARHDALTRLPNRLLFQERLEQSLAYADGPERIALMCLDLDQFKMVNDTFGHPIGDELLQLVASRLADVVRKADTVARLGGDEFAIILRSIRDENDVAALAERMVKAIGAPYDVDGNRLTIGVSIGIALAPRHGRTRQQLLRKADLALYNAKQAGRGAWRFFDAALDELVLSRRLLERDLRDALESGQLELHYQPVVNTRTRQVSGFEGLLRWHHPSRGPVSPGEFIPIAEETGAIVPIGAWALQQACSQAMTWPLDLTVAVNLSAVQFRDENLVQTVADALGRSGLPSERLVLEITESVLLGDNQATLSVLHRLRRLGVRIAMDDFGTGYSSLSYLRSFPFDIIKIDQSFVRGLETRDECTAIIRAVIGLGKSLRMRIVAEGVETAEQLEILTVEGCVEVQGYFFCKPVPVAQLPDVIARLSGTSARTEASYIGDGCLVNSQSNECPDLAH